MGFKSLLSHRWMPSVFANHRFPEDCIAQSRGGRSHPWSGGAREDYSGSGQERQGLHGSCYPQGTGRERHADDHGGSEATGAAGMNCRWEPALDPRQEEASCRWPKACSPSPFLDFSSLPIPFYSQIEVLYVYCSGSVCHDSGSMWTGKEQSRRCRSKWRGGSIIESIQIL